MKALSGLRMLDLTHMMAGPYASMMLADLGMDVIKIEIPGRGDMMRHLLPPDSPYSFKGMGAYFLTLSRNKKSMTLDLKSDAGREVFYELVGHADVVMDNFSAGVTGRLKVGYEHLSAINPRIITCSVTGFGSDGPGKDWTAFDLVAQGVGGGMSICGRPGDPPTRAGIPIGDVGGGLMAVIGVLAALVAREQTGRGQHVDIALLDAQVGMLNYIATMYNISGILPRQQGNGHFLHIPYDTYPTSDGWIIVAVILDPFWKSLVRVLDLPELDTVENETQVGRTKNAADINGRLAERFRSNTQAYWLEKLRAVRIPCGPVHNIAQVMSNPQVLHRNMIVEVEHPDGGAVQVPGNPVKLSETHEDTFNPPPTLGQHTEEVLKTLLGKSGGEIAALREAGTI